MHVPPYAKQAKYGTTGTRPHDQQRSRSFAILQVLSLQLQPASCWKSNNGLLREEIMFPVYRFSFENEHLGFWSGKNLGNCLSNGERVGKSTKNHDSTSFLNVFCSFLGYVFCRKNYYSKEFWNSDFFPLPTCLQLKPQCLLIIPSMLLMLTCGGEGWGQLFGGEIESLDLGRKRRHIQSVKHMKNDQHVSPDSSLCRSMFER